jgi:starvation-inducible DNA-binding protein
VVSTTPGTNVQVNRRAETEVRIFDASPEFAGYLQRILVDLVELHLQGK